MKDNGLLKKKCNITLLVALLLTIGFVVGIPSIVFGATKGWTLLLVVGIVLTAVGFYVMPVMWVKFGNMRSRYNVFRCIVDDGITDIDTLSTNFGWKQNNTVDTVRWLITNRYLTNVTFDGKVLHSTVPQKQRRLRCVYCGTIVNDINATKCPNCSGQLVADDIDNNDK